MVDVTGIKELFQTIHLWLIWYPFIAMATGELSVILDKRWFYILEIYRTLCNWDFRSMVSVLVISAYSMTSEGDEDTQVDIEDGAEAALVESQKES